MLSFKPWQPLAVIQYCAAVLICICLGGLLGTGLQQLHPVGFKQTEDIGYLILGTFSFQGTACVFIFLFFRYHKIDWRTGFGFRGPNLKRALLQALLAFAIILPAVWMLQGLCVFTLTKLGHPPDEQDAVRLIENARGWWSRTYLAIFAVGLAPVAEEFIFRGLLYPFIKQLGWPRLALIGLSLLFALIHFDVATFPALFFLALALTWLYERTDNLLAPIAVHALFNATNLGMLVLKHFYPEAKS